ncbi:hypothetical protein QUB60_11050 [Microcoleus sp. A2-C5]|nr:hypothetical protein [Lyngbya sp. CCAP 1446/10]
MKEEGRRKKEEGKEPFGFAFPLGKNKEEERTESTRKRVGFK